MDANHLTDDNVNIFDNIYLASFDLLRVLCMILFVLVEFGLEFVPYYSYVKVLLNFAPGTFFTLYGFLVLKDGADLSRNIKHALKVFIIMLAIYGLLTAGYNMIIQGNPFANLNKRGIFSFIVLNYWGTSFCANIWMVQSTLYALVLFQLLRRWKRFDWLLCIILFVISTLIGELAGVIGFSFLGYSCIPGNFLTRAMPYMLLGRLIRNHFDVISEKLRHGPFFYFFIGLALSIAEFAILVITGKDLYVNHLMGFILMSASLCIYGVCIPQGYHFIWLEKYAPVIYKGMYYIYNPLGYLLVIAAQLLCRTLNQYIMSVSFVGLAVLLLTFTAFLLVAVHREKKAVMAEENEDFEVEFM